MSGKRDMDRSRFDLKFLPNQVSSRLRNHQDAECIPLKFLSWRIHGLGKRGQKFQKIFSQIKQRIENSKMYGQSRLTGSLRKKELRAGQVSTTGAGSSHLLISKNN